MKNKCVICHGDDSKIAKMSQEQINKLINKEAIGPICEKCKDVYLKYKFLEIYPEEENVDKQ